MVYGVIIEAIVECIKTRYGKNVWEQVKLKSKIDQDFFSTHQQYSYAAEHCWMCLVHASCSTGLCWVTGG